MARRKRTRKAKAKAAAQRAARRGRAGGRAGSPPQPGFTASSPSRIKQGWGGGVYLGYRELIGGNPTWKDLEARLRHYSLAQVFESIGRMSVLLESEKVGFFEKQALLLRGCFTAELGQSIARKLDADRLASQQNPAHPPSIAIDETSLFSVLKAACWLLEPGGGEQPQSLQPLAEALLMINDLTDQAKISPEGAPIASADGLRRWAYYLTVNGLFRHRERQMHAMARTFELYLSDRTHLRGRSSHYLDLPSLVTRSTGLKPEEFWSIDFAFMAHFATLDPTEFAKNQAFINRRAYFGAGYAFTDHQIDRFLSFVGRNLDDVAAEMRQQYNSIEVHPFSVTPLSKSPLVFHGDLVIAPYLPELYNKLTSGLHYFLLDALPAGDRAGYLAYIGDVFEDYITQLMLRAYPGRSGGPRFIDGATLRAAVPGSRKATPKICDGLLLYDDGVILLETKARILSAPARQGHDEEGFFKKLEEILVRGAAQLHETIGHIRAGRLASVGVIPDRVRRFYPLIVSLQTLPMLSLIPDPDGGLLYKWVAQQLVDKGVLQEDDVEPLQLMSAGEIEEAEARIAAGDDLKGMLDSKSAHPLARVGSFHNFFRTFREVAQKPTNRFLEERYQALTEHSVQFFREHQRPAPES